MPVPWRTRGDKGFHHPIPNVADRAMQLRQLRQMRALLQRLCKTKLLWRTNYQTRERERITWYALDMYDIANEVIKPIIKFLERSERGQGATYSWTELVATGRQAPRILFSHAWAGHFRDFMCVVDAVADSNHLVCTDSIWVCTFGAGILMLNSYLDLILALLAANNQFGQDFGTALQESSTLCTLRPPHPPGLCRRVPSTRPSRRPK